MEGGGVYSGSNMTVFLQNDRIPPSSDALESLWISNSSPPVHGDAYSCSTSMVNSEDVKVENQTNMTMFPPFEKEENGIEDCDGCYYQPEKKRRLTADQVHCLERNFEVENKLEPERKLQLAKELGLQPRQVAIWFQNRRARYKTKQLEKDYGALKVDYDKLMGNYDSLLKEKERLKNEVQLLAEKLIHREKEKTNSESTQTINPIVAEYQKQILNSDSEMKSKDPMLLCKQEDASSAKSDVFDSEQSDGENELFPKSLLPTQLFFPKLEDGYFDDQTENTCNWSFSVEGQPSWLWPS